METPVVQRWRDRRGTYRPAGEVIVPAHYEVAEIHDDTTAKSFILQHHYSKRYVNARFRFGLYWGPLLVGVAVFSHPMRDAVLDAIPFGTGGRREGPRLDSGAFYSLRAERKARVELGRLVMLDFVPANAESFFVARCFELLRKQGIVGVLSFSDPVPRSDISGRMIMPGHVGVVYQALGGVYLGREEKKRTVRLLPDGTVICDRTISKIRGRERNWQSAAEVLEAHGASRLTEREDSRAWLAHWLPKLTRPLRRDGGNHKYIWAIDKGLRPHLPAGQRYPKFDLMRGVAA